jgi:hypothetical protein
MANKGCHRAGVHYNEQVRLNCHLLSLAMAAALMLACTGCGGVNASQTVSPASFLLPGLLKVDPPMTNAPAAAPVISKEVALAQ